MDEKHIYKTRIQLAGVPVCMCTRYPEAAEFYVAYGETDTNAETELYITDEEWKILSEHGILSNGQNEASVLTAVASDYLLTKRCCIIHAVALHYHGKAWLITGTSGAGKSTQAELLRKIEPEEFGVICGDRPVLQLIDDGVLVHPSPWNGKENRKGAPAAPLAGIICLARGETNHILSLGAKEAVIPIYLSLIQTGITEDGLRRAADFADKLLRCTSVWSMTSESVPESTHMLYQSVFNQEAGNEI